MNKLGPSRCGATLIAIALLAIAMIATVVLSIPEADDNEFELRPRLGHFNEILSYREMYEGYYGNVTMHRGKAYETTAKGAWRRVRPTKDVCMRFLQGFVGLKLTLSKPFDIIPLDACLDWLFSEDENKQFDMKSAGPIVTSQHSSLQKNEDLIKIFQSTKFGKDKDPEEKIPDDLKIEIRDYLVKLLNINHNNPTTGCHNLWLETYDDFIEELYLRDCEEEQCPHYGLKGSDEDSYLRLIAESTIAASKSCYQVMQMQLPSIVLRAFNEEKQLKRLLKSSNGAARQSADMKWSREMIRVLQIASSTPVDREVDLGQVTRALEKLKQQDPEVTERFTAALADYALHNTKPKKDEEDATGEIRYTRAMVKLCKPYINEHTFEQTLSLSGDDASEEPGTAQVPFEYYGIIYSLIRLTNHLDLYGISKEKFQEDIMKYKWESLYLATFTCQLVLTTWGQLSYETNEVAFQVIFRSGYEAQIADWPISILSRKLAVERNVMLDPVQAPQSLESPPRSPEPGFKISLLRRRKVQQPQVAQPARVYGDDDDDDDDGIARPHGNFVFSCFGLGKKTHKNKS